MMFEENVINFILVSVFCAISLSYIFDINFISSLIITSSVFFISFMITFFFAEKRYIKPVFKPYILGMIISAIFTIFKIPFYPIMYLEIYYYQKARKMYDKKVSSEEILKVSRLFITTLFLFSILGILLKNPHLAIFSSTLIISLLIPYPNSLGSSIFMHDRMFFAIILFSSLIFILISLTYLVSISLY